MTRKFFSLLLSLACALCLAACDDALSGGTESHQHNWSSYYLMDGEKYYQTCAGCDEKKYADSDDGKDLVLGVHIKSTDGFIYSWANGSWVVADFDSSSGVSSVTIKGEYRGKPVTSINPWAFEYCSNLKSIIIPNSVTNIGEGAFASCSNLTNITIPDSVTGIDWDAFYKCSSLTSVTIPDSVTSIKANAFTGCSSLTNVTIPDGVTEIEYGTFRNCSGLTSITIPDSVTSIGNEAFCGCTGLKSMAIGKNITAIGDRVFSGCDALRIISVDNDNPIYSSQDGILYGNGKTELICVPKAISGAITIPNGVTHIWGAFRECTGLTSITIPNSVTNIGYQEFKGCTGLISVTIPDGVTEISGEAFKDCTGLTNVTIGKNVTIIGCDVFERCSSLTSITFNGTKAQWQAIDRYSVNCTIICMDGEISE